MKDIPVFTTEHGVASLVLKEIPYRKEAYIHLQDSLEPELLLEECLSFCRICGAQRVYASGNPILETRELHTRIWEMTGSLDPDPDEVDHMWPVTSDTVSQWRQIHNRRMTGVDNAGTLEARDEQRILESGGAYFIHHSGRLLGIGWINGNRIEAIAAVERGAGDRILRTLLSLSPNVQMTLQVASTNKAAIALYERNGFLRVREIASWYVIKKETV